jgi:hypothetical protein
MDRRSSLQSPEKNHIADKEWAKNPVKLFANMFELTEALCHNYWYVLSSLSTGKTPPWAPTFSRRLRRTKISSQIANIVLVYRKPAETEMWDSDDSDIPYTDAEDVPGAQL